MAKISVAPYLVGTVNHAMKNEMTKITVVPYLAGAVDHAAKNETVKITDSIFIWHVEDGGERRR